MRLQVSPSCSVNTLTCGRAWKNAVSGSSPLSFPLKLSMEPFSHVDAGSMYSSLDPALPDHQQAGEHLQHVSRPDGPAGPDRQTLPGVFADDCQHAYISAVTESRLHEVVCLNVVRPLGPRWRCIQGSPRSRLTGADVRDGSGGAGDHECAPGLCRPAVPGPDSRDLVGTDALTGLAETLNPRLRRTGFSPRLGDAHGEA